MFDIPGSEGIQSYQEAQKDKILGSFNSDDSAAKATLVKGISLNQLDALYPMDKFLVCSFDSLSKAKDDFMKAEGATEQDFQSQIVGFKPVVVQSGVSKKLFYVKEKATV